MAQKVFKGFKQEVEGQFTAEAGYIYFVRTNTGATDGYLQLDGKKYGTAADAAATLEALIGELPEGYDNVVEYIEAQVSAITGDYATKEEVGTLSGRVDTLSAISAETRIAALEAISADTRIEALEQVSASTRLNVLETSAATKSELGTLSGRVDDLEAISADTRLDALEAISGETHTHDNKDVLDGISAEDVAAWDAAENNAIGAASAYTDSKYNSAVTASAVVLSAFTGESATSGYLKTYELYQGGSSIGKIDIPKDMVVSSGSVVTENNVKYLRLWIANTDPQEHVDIAVSDLAHVYTEGSGITITENDVIEAKVVAQNGLSVDGDGIKLAVATSAQTGAMAAADKEKLDTIAASAQTNVIETVKVDGTALTPDADKAVDIILSGLATNETVGTLSGRVDTLEASAATKNEVGTLSGRVDTLSAISAETRIAALEEVSADTRLDVLEASALTAEDLTAITANITALSAVSAETRITALETSAHTHDNQDVLDTITSADTESWDAALQEVVSSSTIDVTTKADGKQTISVKVSAATGNTISTESDGLFAAIYYDGDDSE